MVLKEIEEVTDQEFDIMLTEKKLSEIDIFLNFYSLIHRTKYSFLKEERVKYYRNLEKGLEWFYKKKKVGLVNKIKNKKYMEEIFNCAIENKISIKSKKLIEEIPDF